MRSSPGLRNGSGATSASASFLSQTERSVWNTSYEARNASTSSCGSEQSARNERILTPIVSLY
eukprot:4203234-Pleurochrysis_carterae.AAC.1